MRRFHVETSEVRSAKQKGDKKQTPDRQLSIRDIES